MSTNNLTMILDVSLLVSMIFVGWVAKGSRAWCCNQAKSGWTSIIVSFEHGLKMIEMVSCWYCLIENWEQTSSKHPTCFPDLYACDVAIQMLTPPCLFHKLIRRHFSKFGYAYSLSHVKSPMHAHNITSISCLRDNFENLL